MIKQSTKNKFLNVDSQSALRATNSYVIRNKSVKKFKQTLNKISEYNKVILDCMPGLKIADKMAKAWGKY